MRCQIFCSMLLDAVVDHVMRQPEQVFVLAFAYFHALAKSKNRQLRISIVCCQNPLCHIVPIGLLRKALPSAFDKQGVSQINL